MAIKIGGTTVIDDNANITTSVGGFKTVGGVDITGSGNINAAPSTDFNAVGTYVWAYRNVVSGSVSYNSTYAGTDLRATGTGTYPYSRQAYGDNIGTSGMSGTWRAMGNGSGANSRYGTTLFVRIS